MYYRNDPILPQCYMLRNRSSSSLISLLILLGSWSINWVLSYWKNDDNDDNDDNNDNDDNDDNDYNNDNDDGGPC